jgi:hypothetical protein
MAAVSEVNTTGPNLRPWEPASPSAAAALFATADFPWWIAGGYSMELAVKRALREHGDLDVLVLHRDQERVRAQLATWDLHLADPPGVGTLRPWSASEDLPPQVHDVWCRRSPGDPWSVQLMFDEADGEQWVSRRDARVSRPISQLGFVTADGIPYLRPAVQLFYKAKSVRGKDQLDFEAVLPLLSDEERAWLVAALRLTMPDHAWQERLGRR